MATISDFLISEGLNSPQPSNSEPKTLGPSSTIPGAFIKVKFDDLEVLEASDSDQNLKFRRAFLSQNGIHLRFWRANSSVKTNPSL